MALTAVSGAMSASGMEAGLPRRRSTGGWGATRESGPQGASTLMISQRRGPARRPLPDAKRPVQRMSSVEWAMPGRLYTETFICTHDRRRRRAGAKYRVRNTDVSLASLSTLIFVARVTIAFDKWSAYARLLTVAPAGDLPTAATPRPGARLRLIAPITPFPWGVDNEPLGMAARWTSVKPRAHGLVQSNCY